MDLIKKECKRVDCSNHVSKTGVNCWDIDDGQLCPGYDGKEYL